MIFFFHQCWFFCSVSSWKISSCFKPVQFWSNSSLVVDKTTIFPWLCVLSLLPPLHIMYFTLLKTSQLSFALWLGGSFFFFSLPLLSPSSSIILTYFAIVSLTPTLCGLHTTPWLEWDLTKLTHTQSQPGIYRIYIFSYSHTYFIQGSLSSPCRQYF